MSYAESLGILAWDLQDAMRMLKGMPQDVRRLTTIELGARRIVEQEML